jgi:hypothetical protein
MQNIGKSILAISFLSAIFLGFVATLSGWDPAIGPINENRSIAPPPTLSWTNLTTTIEETDKYFADNFGFRKVMIRAHALFQHFVLNAYSAENIILEKIGIEE